MIEFKSLEEAIITGNVDRVKSLIEQGVDVNISSTEYSNLHKAVGVENIAILQILLDAGGDANAKDSDGNTPLMYAASLGNLAIAKLLINSGARVNLRNNCYETAIAKAAWWGQEIIVNYLYPKVSELERKIADNWLEDGITRKQSRKNSFNNEFFKAVESSDFPQIHNCIDKKVNLDALTEEGETALHIAVRNNDLKSVKILIEAGASTEIIEKREHTTPLISAILWSHTEVVELLLKAGANIKVKDIDGNYALNLAKEIGKAKIIELLLKAETETK